MKKWKLIGVFAALVAFAVFWVNAPGHMRLYLMLGTILWGCLTFATWLVLLGMNEKAYKPNPWGTRFQKKVFRQVLLFGPFMVLFIQQSTARLDPTSKMPLD